MSFVTALDPTALMRTNLLESFPLKAFKGLESVESQVTLLGLDDPKPWSNLRKLQLLHRTLGSYRPVRPNGIADALA